MARKSTERAPSLAVKRPDLSRALIDLVDSCLEIDAARRPESARDFLVALEEVIRHLPHEDGDGPENSLTAMRAEALGGVGALATGVHTPVNPGSAPSPMAAMQVTGPLPRPGMAVLSDPRYRSLLIGVAVVGFIGVLYAAFGGSPTEVANPKDPAKPGELLADRGDPGSGSLQDLGSSKTVRKTPLITPKKVDTPPPSTTATDGDGGDASDGDNGEKGADSGKSTPKVVKPDPYNSSECKEIRKSVNEARTGGNWNAMLKALDRERVCFRRGDLVKLRTLAYKELRDFEQCVKVGKGSRDAEVQKWVSLCEKRANRP